MYKNYKRKIFTFLSITFVSFLIFNTYIPKLITIDLIANKYIYFAVKDCGYAVLVAFWAMMFLRGLKLKEIAAWIMLSLVLFPVCLTVIGVCLFNTAHQMNLLLSGAAYALIYWPISVCCVVVGNRFFGKR